ncbi:hypothetical protein [Nonomuraea sp. NPDC023979]|uniref:hypothetical protein n=1 Tax=Nonomuraea sp. NPDC023979 TaxID=3154796 RepID=UPI0033C45660
MPQTLSPRLKLFKAVNRRLETAHALPDQAWLHVEELTGNTVNATAFCASGKVISYTMSCTQGERLRLGAPTIAEVEGVDAPTMSNMASMLLAHGPDVTDEHAELTLEAIATSLEEPRAVEKDARQRRDSGLCELFYFYGWQTKARLYTLVDIDRPALNAALARYNLSERGGLRSGDDVRVAVLGADVEYRQAVKVVATMTMLRDALIQALRHEGRFRAHRPVDLARLAGVTTQRIAQICAPDYRERRAAQKRDRAHEGGRRRPPTRDAKSVRHAPSAKLNGWTSEDLAREWEVLQGTCTVPQAAERLGVSTVVLTRAINAASV